METRKTDCPALVAHSAGMRTRRDGPALVRISTLFPKLAKSHQTPLFEADGISYAGPFWAEAEQAAEPSQSCSLKSNPRTSS